MTWRNPLMALALTMPLALQANPARFYANVEKQQAAPEAYALSEDNQPWLEQAHRQRALDAHKFVAALKQSKALYQQLKTWPDLTFEQRMALLPEVFKIECETFGITPPALIINTTLYPQRPVNFVFDVRNPGSGLVYLNPDKLKTMEVWAPLAFLVHETRHAWQYQLAFSDQGMMAAGYKQAFTTQSKLEGASFSDFLTLLNEYEAFQFGNHVLELLTEGEFDSVMMGTFASQFDEHQQLKIDLTTLGKNTEKKSVLEQFNEAMKVQYELRYPAKEQ